ncbi:hypothetical protein H5410_056566, partial [Solanum commersonii]
MRETRRCRRSEIYEITNIPIFLVIWDKHRSKLSKLPRNISRSFDGHKEIILVATTKPIEQGLSPQQVYKQ